MNRSCRLAVLKRAFIPVVLFIAAFAATAVQYPEIRLGPGFETLALARNLAANGAFANPFSLYPTGPSAHSAPLYPAFLALLLKLFGNSAIFGLLIDGLTIAMHALHAALLPAVSQLLFHDRRPGIWAAVISIVLPVYLLFPQYEFMYAAAGLMIFCLATARLRFTGGAAGPLATGLGLGAIALLNPACITIALAWLGWLLWRRRPDHALRFLFCTALAAAAVLAPWTLRNYALFHRWFFVRDNLGLELYIANNDHAEGSFARNEANGDHALTHPSSSLQEARVCADLGEAEYDHRRGMAAMVWIRSHPGRFTALTATRIRMFWFPDADDTPWHARSIAMVTVLAALGLALLARRRDPVFWFFAASMVCYPAVYYLLQADPRYSPPLLWIPLLAGGYLLSEAARRVAAVAGGLRASAASSARLNRPV